MNNAFLFSCQRFVPAVSYFVRVLVCGIIATSAEMLHAEELLSVLEGTRDVASTRETQLPARCVFDVKQGNEVRQTESERFQRGWFCDRRNGDAPAGLVRRLRAALRLR